MELLILLGKTLLLRSYVFIFLGIAIATAVRLIGGARATIFFVLTWGIAFACEYSSTRTGIPFGLYLYNGSTRGQELYISNVPFMDSLSFTFLLFCSYCLALLFLLPSRGGSGMGLRDETATRTSSSALVLSVLFFVLIDVVIDPIALRGDRWFLGKIYYYPEPGLHFGVPIANYLGWAFVGIAALGLFQWIDRRMLGNLSEQRIPEGTGSDQENKIMALLAGGALYYGVLLFNLTVTFWIDEPLIGTVGLLMYLPTTLLLALRLAGRMPSPPS